MGQFSVEKPVLPGSALSGNQQAGDVFRSEPTTRPGALALLHFLGGEVGSTFAAWRQEALGAILHALAVLDA